MWTTPAFYSARSQSTALALAVYSQRDITGCLGWLQPYRVGRTFSDWRARGYLVRNYLAGVVRGFEETNTARQPTIQAAVIFPENNEPVLVSVERVAQRDSNF